MSSFSKRNAFLASAALFATVASTAASFAVGAQSSGFTTLYDGPFARVPAERETGRSVAAHCQIDGAAAPDHWADARAELVLSQSATASEVTVTLESARPDTLFTIWLMLAGGSPLMEAGATALIHSDDLAAAVDLMGAPDTVASNGFTTDADGNGHITLTLDYPIVGGAFPFQRYAGFDAENEVFTRDAPRAIPVAIADAATGAPFTLRLASHCGDNLHNGLIAGQHEPWFDWRAE